MGEHRIDWVANEGARVSRIVAHLESCKAELSDARRHLLDQLLDGPSPSWRPQEERRNGPGPTNGLPEARMAADGTVTWTIPLSVSVHFGCVGAQPAPTVAPSLKIPGVAAPQPQTLPSGNGVMDAVAAAKAEWTRRSDVLDVRLGYVFRDGWITPQRALVASVLQKKSQAALREAGVEPLPDTFRGLPVEVTNPSLAELVALARGPAAAEAVFSQAATLAEEILYTPPAGGSLEAVTADMRVVAHVSPDAGWPQLEAFLAGIKKRLVVGMYDFGAPHIVEALEHAAAEERLKEMTLIMQTGESVGSGTKVDDLRDQEVVDRLAGCLGAGFKNAWVRLGPVNGWVASSYHIKLAVRDGAAFWLSSGNWQSSNLPDAEPLVNTPPDRTWIDRYNRDWHVIIEHPGLAKRLEAFLLHDFAQNSARGVPEMMALPDLLVPVAERPHAEERAARFKYFKPFDERRKFTVQPLLTPDNYHEHVLRLIDNAQEELLIQNQTFNAPKSQHQRLRELMEAVLAKKRKGASSCGLSSAFCSPPTPVETWNR